MNKQYLEKELRKILAEHEVNGISKNQLITKLKKIASRVTIYKYWDEILNKKILVEKKFKSKQKRCFPTEENKKLDLLQKKLDILEDTIRFIEKHDNVGDCFATTHDIKNIELFRIPNKLQKQFKINQLFKWDSVNSKSSKEKYVSFTIYSLTARRDFFKELPLFLIYYINNLKEKYPNEVKEEYNVLIKPIIERSFYNLSKDYSEYFTSSNSFRKLLRKNLPRDKDAQIFAVKGHTHPNQIIEFLKILGRLYFCMSIIYSKKLQHNSTKEQIMISNMIKSFYESLTPFQYSNLEFEYRDPHFIEKYYFDLFSKLGISIHPNHDLEQN